MSAAALILSIYHILPNDLAVANPNIEPRGVDFTSSTHFTMAWEARLGCPPHHRAAVERMVNALPPSYLLPPISGEPFDSLEHCNRRLRGWALAEGFDIVRRGGGTKVAPGYRFKCIFYGDVTRNHRKLEDTVEKDLEGKIVSRRKKEVTNVRQLGCEWSALCSFKDIGILVEDTPPRPGGEFQGGLSVALAIRSPEGPPRASPARSPIAVDPVTFRPSREDSYAPPASTAPPRLVESEGRPKRKRAPTRGRYKDAVAEE
jgi:hypothetical protein